MRIALALVALLAAPSASAFKVYTSDDSGAPLRWFTSGLVVSIDSGAPDTVPADTATEQIRQGYLTWSNLACDGEPTPFAFTFEEISGASVGYFDGAANTNLLVWVDQGWPHESNITGLTTLTFDTSTGQIVDADMELNEVHFRFSLDGSPGRADVLNTVVHETGHVLGLDHSSVRDSTMFATADLGEVKKRSLHIDDIEGYCALYGPNALPIPGPGPSTPGDAQGSGCTATGKPASGGPVWLLLTLLGLLSLRWTPATRR